MPSARDACVFRPTGLRIAAKPTVSMATHSVCRTRVEGFRARIARFVATAELARESEREKGTDMA
jgi:hypothetical protein